MRKLLLLLLPFFPLCLQAQFAVPPKTLTNGTSYTNTVEISRDQMYRWVISLRGPAHVVVRVHSSWNGLNSGYVRADSVSLSSGTGFTDFIVQASGDSLMNQWLPDDSGSMGTAGSVMKARPGWKATITVQALSSGNGGLIALSTTSLTYAPPATDDTYAYTRWLAGIDYATPDMIISLPSQTGNNGKYLKTDGTDLSWDTPAGGTGDTTGTTNQPMQSRLEDDVKAAKDTASAANKAANTADGKAVQAQSTANVAYNVAQGKAGADSVHTALLALQNLIAGKANADSIHSQLILVYNMLAGKPNADSVHTAIAAMLKMSDTTALHAQKFAIINDSLLAVSLRATTTKNDLTAHIGTVDAHLPSQTGNNGKFLQSNGTVTSWQSVPSPDLSGYLEKSDTTFNVRTTHPQIPGLASSDTNTVIGVDASGNLVLRKDDAGTGGSGAYNLDSARFALSDTAYIAVTDSLRPKRQNSTTAYVMGWTEFQIVPNKLIGVNATMTGQIVSDSANGVKIMAWRFEGWGYVEFQTGFGGYMDLFFSNDGAKFARNLMRQFGGRFLDMLLIGDQTTQTNVRVQLYCGTGSTSYGLATIRVFYVAPATSTSSQPIRLIGW